MGSIPISWKVFPKNIDEFTDKRGIYVENKWQSLKSLVFPVFALIFEASYMQKFLFLHDIPSRL